MGIAKKTDGRYVVGMGVTDANDYKGSASYRDIYIQLTADGATGESVEYLTYLKDYAAYHSALGEPIMPPSVNVWISNNGVTTAVEADDLALDGDNFTICGIKWNGSSWDYSNAGEGGGGGGASLPSYTIADEGKVLTVMNGGVPTETGVVVEESITCEVVDGYDEPIGAITETAILYSLKIGDTITVTINDEITYTGVVEDYGEYGIGYYDDTAQSGVSWSVSDDWAYFSYVNSGTYSVKIEAALPVLSEVYNDTLTFDSHYMAMVEPCPVALKSIAIGDLIKLTINGTSIMGMVSDYASEGIGIHNDELGMGVLWNTGDDMAMFGNTEVGSYAVKVEAPVPELDAEWNAVDKSPCIVNFDYVGGVNVADKTFAEVSRYFDGDIDSGFKANNVVIFSRGGTMAFAYKDPLGRAISATAFNCNNSLGVLRAINMSINWKEQVGLTQMEYILTPAENGDDTPAE